MSFDEIFDLVEKKSPFLCVYDLCDSSIIPGTEDAYPHIKSNNVISHHIPRTTCYMFVVLFWFAVWLYTVWSCG